VGALVWGHFNSPYWNGTSLDAVDSWTDIYYEDLILGLGDDYSYTPFLLHAHPRFATTHPPLLFCLPACDWLKSLLGKENQSHVQNHNAAITNIKGY
jgi:hypothetical protein